MGKSVALVGKFCSRLRLANDIGVICVLSKLWCGWPGGRKFDASWIALLIGGYDLHPFSKILSMVVTAKLCRYTRTRV